MTTGTAVQVVVANEDHSFTLDESALSKILYDPRVKDRKIIVLSIAGAFRKGKSFLLNFFLQFLNALGLRNWIGDPDAPLKGFDSKFGTERNTSGILMWSEPFQMKLANGEEVCVLLMDTQGTFDSQSTVKDCATIFALSTLLSSVQIYNLMLDIQETDLQHLQYFAEYARLTKEKTESKPFQNLHFLVRDWVRPTEYAYGWEGGQKYLEKYFETKNGQHEDLKNIRDEISSLFTTIKCFLMPHPGLEVVTDPNYDGRFSGLSKDFKPHVQEFVTSSMSSENLVVKEINGYQITGEELFKFFKAYMKIFQSNELPEPMSIHQATAELNNSTAVSKAKDLYTACMNEVCGDKEQFLHPEKLELEHDRCREEAVQLFQSIRKMGGEKMSDDFQAKLEAEIKESYKSYELINYARLMVVVNHAVAMYSERMMEFCAKEKYGVDSMTLKQKHDRLQKEIIDSLLKLVDQKSIYLFRERTNTRFSQFKSENSGKQYKLDIRLGLAAAAGTVVFVGTAVLTGGMSAIAGAAMAVGTGGTVSTAVAVVGGVVATAGSAVAAYVTTVAVAPVARVTAAVVRNTICWS